MSTRFFFSGIGRDYFLLASTGFLRSTSTEATFLPTSTDDDFWHTTFFGWYWLGFFWSGLTKAIFLLTSTRVYLIDCQMRQFYGRHRVFLDDVSQWYFLVNFNQKITPTNVDQKNIGWCQPLKSLNRHQQKKKPSWWQQKIDMIDVNQKP